MVCLLIGKLTAPSGGNGEDADQYRDEGEDQDNVHRRIVPCSTRDVAFTAELGGNDLGPHGRAGG
jgi:hypothetical protein